MGTTWKSPEQSEFLARYVATYFECAKEGKLKEFWAEVAGEWFKCFPLGDPPAKLVQKEGSEEKAAVMVRLKKIKVSQPVKLSYL